MPARRIWLTCLTMLWTCDLAHAQTLAFDAASYASVTGARGIVVADFNRDGWPDVATANTTQNVVSVLLNRGRAGGFAPARIVPVGAGPFDLAAGDLDGDGIPDVVVSTPDADAIEVLRIGADGGVASRLVLTNTGDSRGLTLADVTRDGSLDLIYSDYSGDRVVVLPGTGLGTFLGNTGGYPVSARPQGVVAADFNHDGFLDVAVASTGSAWIDVLYGSGNVTFSRRTFAAGRAQNVLAAVDLNADGWLDLAAAATSTNVVAVLRGSASGFALAGTRATGASPRGLASGDFNQDGRQDLVTGNYLGRNVTLLLGRRDGSVLPDRWGELSSGNGARTVAAADFDHDGRLDVAVGAQSAARLWVHENSTAFVPPGASFSAAPVALNYFTTSIASADFNHNGIADLLGDTSVLLDGTTSLTLDLGPARYPASVAAGDFDGDGNPDALVLHYGFENGLETAQAVALFRGNGRGGFAAGTTIASDLGEARLARAGDLDRDGDLDLVILAQRQLYVLRQSAAGFVRSVVTMPLFSGVLELADVNRDGILDAVVLFYEPASVSVLIGDGAGGFAAPIAAASTFYAEQLAIGDLNHDGRPDFVIDHGSTVTVILAEGEEGWGAPTEFPSFVPWDTGLSITLGDFNNDGHLDGFTLGGTLLPGNGDGTLQPPLEFAATMPAALALDWNRDGLLDFVNGRQALLNERQPVNRTPVANAGGNKAFPYHRQYQQVDGLLSASLSSDPDLHRMTYEWRDETGTVFGREEIAEFPPKRPGTYSFTLTVRDGQGGEDTDTFQITILAETEIVLHASQTVVAFGGWFTIDDETAASGGILAYGNSGAPKVQAPLANPGNYADLWFVPDPTLTYKLWVRLRAENNYWGNDSVWVQISGVVDEAGRPRYAPGTTDGLPINLEECSGCGISGWGWEDDGWGAVDRHGVTLRFAGEGPQLIRIQNREDGVAIDQIVLSAVKYRNTRPGSAKNDTVILPVTQEQGR